MPGNLLLDIIRNELLDIVGYGDVSVREAERLAYSLDFYLVPQLWIDRNQRLQKPDFVVFPESAEQVSRIHKLANRHGIPIIPYGGGTGSQGGAVPLVSIPLWNWNDVSAKYGVTVTIKALSY